MGLLSKWFTCMRGRNASQKAASTSDSKGNSMRMDLSKTTLNSGSSQDASAKEMELENITTERAESNTETSTERENASIEESMMVTEHPREVDTSATTSNGALGAVTENSRYAMDHHEIAPETREPGMRDIFDPPPSYEIVVEEAKPSQGTTTNAEAATEKSQKRSITRIFSRRRSTASTTKEAPASVTPLWKPTVCPPVPEQNTDPDRFTYVIGGRDYDDSYSIYCL